MVGRGCTCGHRERQPHGRSVPDHPPNGLVHSPGCLLPVPVVPREELRGGGEGGLPIMSTGTLPAHSSTPPRRLQPHPAPPHPGPQPRSELHLIQELHLKENPWGHAVGTGGCDHSTAIPRLRKSSPSLAWRQQVLCPCLSPSSPGPSPKGPPVLNPHG